MTKTKFNSKVIPVQEAEPDRQLKANDVDFNSHYKFADNYIRTSKYTLITFLPKNLFEQFQRVANIYFMFQIIIMSIPAITALKPESTAVPLFFVLAATAIKDAYDDIKRHMSDKEVNNRKTQILKNGKFKEVKWMDVNVGDVIKVNNNEPIPADILLLSSSELNGMCFIETAELDGETNLKCRQPLPETSDLGDDEHVLTQLNGEITCEPPNNRLDKFKGTLLWSSNKYSLDNDKIILRGCVARNTKWSCGLVIFSGHDTKLMMNSGIAKFKRTGLDRLMNKLIIWIALLLAIICLFCSIMSFVWEEETGRNFQVFLPWESYYNDSPILIAVMHWPAFIMVLNTLIPISLYISVEVIRLGHSLLINFDAKMYHPKTDTPAQARTTTLSEELGQIEYIFSDKTGTLTQNVMTFNQCSINAQLFGLPVSQDGTQNNCSAISVTSHTGVDFSDNPYADSKFKFHDQTLLQEVKGNNKNCQEFFRLLSVCHTVMSEEIEGELVYQAQSPDEGALVTAARNFGFVFMSRSPTTITINAMGEEEVYELLCILDFDNVRKRMSVIVRRNNNITLYCKGADVVIYERLNPASKTLQDKTTEHLNTFAGEGLRTLVLASRDLSEEEYDAWKEKQFQASVAMENRDEMLDKLYEEIETNLNLIGATAVEDKLQDGVPETIATLAAANIKIWVLTGDKLETAINIGYSCQLLTDEMEEVFTLDGEDMETVQEIMNNALDKLLPKSERQSFTDARPSLKTSLSVGSYSVKDANSIDVEVISNGPNRVAAEKKNEEKTSKDYALVITGKSLAFALHPSLELDFLKLACLCKAVICCRVTPLQKALVVELVKKHKQAVTLAIGDGANDVSMIKAAHIGVGISGQEGMQAVLASDYSFAQFRFLQRLLLVHGRWSYTRMCQFLNYFFYKNFAFTLNQLWFAFFSGFSAQSLYDPWFISIYNVCFTSLPVLAMGIFDQDVNDENNVRYPKLYLPGQQNLLFNKKIFTWSLFTGTMASLCLFFFTYGTFGYSFNDVGLDVGSHQFIGSVVGGILVITVNLQCGMDTLYWTWINHLFIWGSIAFYFVFFLIFYSEGVFEMFPQGMYVGVEQHIFNNPGFWLCCLLAATCCLMWTFTHRYLMTVIQPTYVDIIKWQQKGIKKGRDIKLKAFHPKFFQRRNSTRSGYAFAHQPGFGRVASGKGFYRRNPVKA